MDCKWFYVLEDLPCDVLLGEETLENLAAFNLETSTVDTEIDLYGCELMQIFGARDLKKKMANLHNLVSNNTRGKRHISGELSLPTQTIQAQADQFTKDAVYEAQISTSTPGLVSVDSVYWNWFHQMLAKENNNENISEGKHRSA